MFRSLRFLLPVALVIGLLTPGVAQAAAPFDHFRYSGTDSFTATDCGLDVAVQVEFRGVVTIRTVNDSDGQAFLAHDNYESTETITHDGNQLVLHGNGVFHEQRGRHVEGTIWAFEFIDAGTFTMLDADGNRLLRDRGVIKIRTVVDTLGDSQPGGILLSEELLALHGPHADESTFCTLFLGELAP